MVPVTWTEVPQIMGSQAVLMAQLAYLEGIPGEFITKASNDTEMIFKLLYGDLERFGHKQVHMLHLLAILSMAELQTFRVVC